MNPTFLDSASRAIEHEVSGQKLTFYPLRVRTAFKLRHLAKPLAKGLSLLFGAGGQDRAHTARVITADTGDAIQETVVSAIEADLAKERAEQLERAVAEVTDAVLNESSLQTLLELLQDSLRGEREKELLASLVVGELDLTQLGEFLVGIGKANFKALPDPLAKRLRPLNAEDEASVAEPEETVGET